MNRKYIIFETEPATPPSPPEPGEAPGKYRQILIEKYRLDPKVNMSEDTAKALLWLHESGQPGILTGDFSVLERLNIMAASPFLPESFDQMLDDMLGINSIEVPPDFEPKSTGPAQAVSPTTTTKNLTLYVGRNTSLDPLAIPLKIDPSKIPSGALILNPKTGKTSNFTVDGKTLKLTSDIGIGQNSDYAIVLPVTPQSEFKVAALNAVGTTLDKFPPETVLAGLSAVDASEKVFENMFRPIEEAVVQEAANNLSYFYSAGIEPNPVQSQLAILGATFNTVASNVDTLKELIYPTRYIYLLDKETLESALMPIFQDDASIQRAIKADPHMFYFSVMQQLRPMIGDSEEEKQAKYYYTAILNEIMWDTIKVSFSQKAAACDEFLFSRTLPSEQIGVAAGLGLYTKPRYVDGSSREQYRYQVNEWKNGIKQLFSTFLRQTDSQPIEFEQMLDDILDDLKAGQGVEAVLAEFKRRGYSWGGMDDLIKEAKAKLGG